MVVNLNPGSVAGGSGGQYFVGDFDGTTFTSESTVTEEPAPSGTVLEDFDDGSWGVAGRQRAGQLARRTVRTAPAAGTLPGQNPVTGFRGAGLVNGFHDGDWPVGTAHLARVHHRDEPFLNFLVGGGRHPHVPGGQLGNEPPAGSCCSTASSTPTACPWPTAAGS